MSDASRGSAPPSGFEAQRARSQVDFREKIPGHLARIGWSAEQIAAHQTLELRALLRRALARSPFHARRLGRIDPDAFALADLPSLPTMTKDEMMASFDDVVTDRRLTLRAVDEQLARTGETPSLLEDEVLCLASGGSSGLRGVFVWHWRDCSDYLLAQLRASMARALSRGGPPGGGMVAALVAAGSGVHATRAFAALFSSDAARLCSVPATLPLADVVARLNEIQPMMLVGYPSLLALLAEEKRAGRLAITPGSITGTSEVFSLERQTEIARAFGCPVSNSFGSSEGLSGVSLPGEEAIDLASDLAIVELVDERNRPVAPGETSAKVLVTSLYNRAQPLIRYELTDRMRQHPPSPAHGHLRVSVEGRADDVFAYGALLLHPLAIRSVFAKTPEVTEYQVRQTANGIAAAVVALAPIDREALAAKLADSLARAGLRSPSVSLEIVERIARHPQTGKVARFVPL
jgi:phenylacetate-coenzyme A ligase PaaK-like adenylate-forming protein